MTSAASVPVTAAPSGASGKLKLVAVTLAIVAVAELVGPVQFSVGPGKVALLPMLWALLIAAAWGIAYRRVPGVARVATAEQSFAGGLLNAGLLLFVVKLGLTVGAALPQVKQAGWALLFQEFGHAPGPVNAIQGVALPRKGAGCKAPARSKADALQARATPQTAPLRGNPEGSSPEPAPRRCAPSVCGRTRGVARLDGRALASFATP